MNNTTERKFHNMSIEDREMFEYNSYREKQQAEIARINSHPEQRMKYCFSFIEGADDEMRVKCYNKIAEWSAQLDYSEAHF
jgi:lysozyme family protein